MQPVSQEIKLECAQCVSTVKVNHYYFNDRGTVNACEKCNLQCAQCGSTVNVKPYFFDGHGTFNACEKHIKVIEAEIEAINLHRLWLKTRFGRPGSDNSLPNTIGC